MKINRPKILRAYSTTLLFGSIIAGLLVGAMGPVTQAFADESISITCYNLQASETPVGTAIAYDPSAAAGACNSLYYDCKGRCVGCFTDQDYLDSVCVDVSGAMFLK
jgi:hypothetical protein